MSGSIWRTRLSIPAKVPEIELGHAYELAHKFDEALAEYDEAASVAPNSPAGPLEGGMRTATARRADGANRQRLMSSPPT